MFFASQALRPFRGLRFRLALSYVLFFAGILVSLGYVFRARLAAIQEQQVESTLEEEWGAVRGYLRFGSLGPEWFYDRYDPDEAFIVSRLLRVYLLTDAQGHPIQRSEIYESLGFDSPDYIKSVIQSGAKAVRILHDPKGVPYLVRSGVIQDPDHHKYYLAIGRAIAENSRVLKEFSDQYFIIVCVIIVFSGLLGWFLAKRALAPVNSVANTAQRITHSNLNMQIPLRGAGDELDRLIEAFNRMMERLSCSFSQIRQFSTDVSHELRTPLTIVRGQLEVALITAKTIDQYRDAMVNALEDVERLSNIVRALLMLSQAESGQLALKKTRLDFTEIVSDMVDEFQIPAEASNVRLSSWLPNHCFILADRIQIERLLSNLISNAIKYTPSGGHVRVELLSAGDQVTLTVSDNGVGIASDHLTHIFDRFYRVPSSDPEKGLGLGLSFVSWIVRAHGGTIDVKSELHQGTTFTVTLPAGAPDPPQPENVALTASEQLH